MAGMTSRTGKMDVRLPNEPGLEPQELAERLREAVEAELAKSNDRLVQLLDDHWGGVAESPTSPYMVYEGVRYEAEARG